MTNSAINIPSEGLPTSSLEDCDLRTAVLEGLADSAAGRYVEFSTSDSLMKHQRLLAEKAIASAHDA